jgi:hypothetical protein
MTRGEYWREVGRGIAGATGAAAVGAADAATFGLADEAVGLVSPEARDTLRAHQARLQEAHPEASMAGGIGGGLAVPGLAAAKFAKGGATGLRMIGRGLLAGGAEGAVMGAGGAQGENVMEEAIKGGGIGAAAGGLVPGAGGAVSRIGRRALAGGRVARLQQRLLGEIPETNMRGFFGRMRQGPDVRSGDFATQRTARNAALDAVGEGFDEIDSIGLSRATQRQINKAVYETDDDIAALAFRGRNTLDLRNGQPVQTVGELRRMRRELDRGLFEMGDAAPADMIRASDKLHAILDDVPGFSEGNAAYRAQSEANAAWQMGASGSRRAGRLSLPGESSRQASGLRYDIENLPEATQDAFREGRRVRLLEELKTGEPSRELIDAIRAQRGQANETALRQYWPNTPGGRQQYDDFLKDAKEVWSSSELEDVLKNQAERSFSQAIIPRR